MEERLKKFELNNEVLEDFDSLMSKHLDQIEELVISEIDAKSKLLNIVGLCINVRTLIIEGDQRTNVNAIIANICKPELLKNLILNNVKTPSNFSMKKLTSLKMISLNNIRFCNIKVFLEDIVNPEKIEALNFENVDFARNSIEILEKFKNLKYLNLIKVENCKFDNLEFLDTLRKLEKVNIEKNVLNFDGIGSLLNCRFNKQITVELSSQVETSITNSLEIKDDGAVSITVNSQDLNDLCENINLKKIDNILIIISEKYNIEDYIDKLENVKSNISIAIKDASCLTVKQAKELKEKLEIKYINIVDFDGVLLYEKNRYCYEIDKYIKIRSTIDEGLADIDKDTDELTKFLELYKLLGENLVYDNILDENITAYSIANDAKSSNLENGVLERKCIDAGFAEVLKNCLAILGIKSRIIRGNYVGISNERVWNQVRILDNWYNVDLAVDAKRMSSSKKVKTKPECCLIGDKTFSKTHTPKSGKTEFCQEDFNQRIVQKFFKKEIALRRCIENIVYKIKKLLNYNKQKSLPDGEGTKPDLNEDENKD